MKGEGISFWNYSVRDKDGIVVGDSIYKGACAEKIIFFKKNGKNVYDFYLSRSPSEILPLSWFCN